MLKIRFSPKLESKKEAEQFYKKKMKSSFQDLNKSAKAKLNGIGGEKKQSKKLAASAQKPRNGPVIEKVQREQMKELLSGMQQKPNFKAYSPEKNKSVEWSEVSNPTRHV